MQKIDCGQLKVKFSSKIIFLSLKVDENGEKASASISIADTTESAKPLR